MPPDNEAARPSDTETGTPLQADRTATNENGAAADSSENHDIYAAGVLAYREAGWPGVIPAWGPGDKRPVRGFTGDKNYGVYPDDDQIVAWATHNAAANLLIRVTPTLIGLYKDAYGDKTGDKAMVEAENRWGPLPADAWRSTSRIDCPNGSGIYLFKVPEGWRGRGEISFSELAIGDVEIIQHHHRTICAWPSIHPTTGNVYRWFDRNGVLVPEGVVPHIDDHPELPLEWLKGLANTKANRNRERRRKDSQADDNDLPLADVSALLTEGRPTKDVAARFGQALYAITDGSDRHKSMLRHTLALMGKGARGSAGVGYAIRELNKAFVAAVGPTRDYGENEADEEFQRMIDGAGRLLDEGEEEGAEQPEEVLLSISQEMPQHPQQSWSGDAPPTATVPQILQQVGVAVHDLGLVGEEAMAKTVYLAITSRLLDKPVSLGIKGHSASGKSYTVKTVTNFFPPEATLVFTAMSEKALVYSAEEYTHRTIIICEVTAMRENVEDDMTSYFIRTLLSEGRIDYDVTVKDRNGDFTTRKVIKEGPTNLVFTTTQTRVHAENETRVLSLNTNDSTEQTANVLKAIALDYEGADLSGWVDYQRWLASDAAEHRVVVPFALDLAELVPPSAVRLRRDFTSLLALIKTHAMMHQINREKDEQGRVIACVTHDYGVVRDLVAETINEGVGNTAPSTVHGTVAAVVEVNTECLTPGATTTQVAQKLGIDKSNAGRRLKVAADGGYIQNNESRRGFAACWVKGDPLPSEKPVLPTVADLCAAVAFSPPGVLRSGRASDQECCGVAVKKEGKKKETPPDSGAEPTEPTEEELPPEAEVLPSVAQLLAERLHPDSHPVQGGCAVAPNPGGDTHQDAETAAVNLADVAKGIGWAEKIKSDKLAERKRKLTTSILKKLTVAGTDGVSHAAVEKSYAIMGSGILADVLAELETNGAIDRHPVIDVCAGGTVEFWFLPEHSAEFTARHDG